MHKVLAAEDDSITVLERSYEKSTSNPVFTIQTIMCINTRLMNTAKVNNSKCVCICSNNVTFDTKHLIMV